MKKYFKYAIVLVCLFALVVASLTISSCKNEEDTLQFKMAVISDLHVLDESQIGSDASSKAYVDKMSHSQKMQTLAGALLKTTVDDLSEDNDLNVVLVSGDMTEDGSEVAHRFVAEQLKKIEQAGKKVFVINGNHDINKSAYSYIGDTKESIPNVSPTLFKEIYNDFGYSEAVMTDAATLSYMADLDDTKRIIAIDAAYYDEAELYKRDDAYLTDALLAWIESALNKCKQDGKTPIAMLHFPVTGHMGAISPAFGASIMINRSEEICNLLIEGGVQYVYTGHLHTNDTQSYTNANGNVLYDFETGSLSNYATPIRFMNVYNSKIVFDVKNVERIKEEYIPACVSAEEKTEILADFDAYSQKYVVESMYKKILSKIDGFEIASVFEIFGVEENDAVGIIDDFMTDCFEKFAYAKLYEKDVKQGEISVEKIITNAGGTMPSSNYNGTVLEFAIGLINANYHGDEAMTVDSVEYQILKKSVYFAIYLVADFDLFGRIHTINEDIPEIDLMPMATTLIATDKIDVTKENFLSEILHCFSYDGDNTTISTVFSALKSVNGKAVLGVITNKTIINLATNLLKEKAPQFADIIPIFVSAIDANNGTIDMEIILRDIGVAKFGPGTMFDDGPADNYLEIALA